MIDRKQKTEELITLLQESLLKILVIAKNEADRGSFAPFGLQHHMTYSGIIAQYINCIEKLEFSLKEE